MRFTLKNLRFLQYIDYQNVRKTEFLGCQSQEKRLVKDILEDGTVVENGSWAKRQEEIRNKYNGKN